MAIRDRSFDLHAPPPGRSAPGDGEEVAPSLQEALDVGRAAWPEVRLDLRELARDLGARLSPTATPGIAVAQIHLADLYLACACAHGDPGAITALEHEVLPHAVVALRRSRVPRALHDESLQALRVQLLVGADGAAPAIARYHGRGALIRWVQVAAVRVALNLQRRRKTHGVPTETSDLEAHAATSDLELELLKSRAGADFGASFRAALALLSPRERNLLRLHFLDGRGLVELARLHHVHRATVARWLSDARARLLAETRRLLRSRLGLDEREAESLLAFVRSRMDVSLSALLADGHERP